MQDNLKRQTASSMVWSLIRQFGTMGISFISNIILARLLSPDDYGCIGLLAIFIALSNTFVNGGFGSAIIQKQNLTPKDLSTVFFFNIGVAVLLYGVLFLSAPAIAGFYNIPILCMVLRVQGVVLIIDAFCVVQGNKLKKDLQFQKLSIISLTSAIISVGAAIWMAYIGYGVWALVFQQIIFSSLKMILLWLWGHWRPSLVFSIESFRSLFSFGGFVLLTSLVSTFCNNIQGLLIGRFFNPATMGHYTQAKRLEDVAVSAVATTIDQVSYPVLSKVNANRDAMINATRKFSMVVAFIVFPMMILLTLIAEPVITLLYSSKWAASIPYFQILCLSGIPQCLQGITMNSIVAMGKSKQSFYWTFIKRAIGVLVIVVGLMYFGLKGMLWGMVFSTTFSYLVNAVLVSKYVGYMFYRQMLDLIPMFLLSIVSYVISFLLLAFLPFNLYIEMVIAIIVYGLVYLGGSNFFHLQSYEMFIDVAGSYIKRK